MIAIWRRAFLAVSLLAAPAAHAQTAATLAGMNAYNSGDFAAAYSALRAGADAGDADAQVSLGYLYARGQGVTADQMQSFLMYARAAEQGNSEGMNGVGFKYQAGSGVKKDIAEAVNWYCKAVALGNARAMNNLAIMLHDGRDLPRDEAEARSLWLQSAELDHYNAMYNLGASYLRGDGAPIDKAQGAVWMLRAAQNGQAAAQRWLRQSGYRGTLPAAVDWGAMMVPAGRHAPGHTKVCGKPVS
jgi:TPR repeat protein